MVTSFSFTIVKHRTKYRKIPIVLQLTETIFFQINFDVNTVSRIPAPSVTEPVLVTSFMRTVQSRCRRFNCIASSNPIDMFRTATQLISHLPVLRAHIFFKVSVRPSSSFDVHHTQSSLLKSILCNWAVRFRSWRNKNCPPFPHFLELNFSIKEGFPAYSFISIFSSPVART